MTIQHTEQTAVTRGKYTFRVVRASYFNTHIDAIKVYHVIEVLSDGTEEHSGILLAESMEHARLQVIEWINV